MLKFLNIIKNEFNTKNIAAIIFGFCIFFLSKPYFVWHTNSINKLFLFIVILIALINIRRPNKADLIVIPFFFFYILIEMFSASVLPNILGYVSKFSLIYILLMRIDRSLTFLKYVKYIYVVTFSLSLIVYFLIVFGGISIPFDIIAPLNAGKLVNYHQYPFLVSVGPLGFGSNNIRFCGVFDEPGVVGSIAVILLIIDKFNLKSKSNKIIFLAGILSFSFYFYLSFLAYVLYKTTVKKRLFFLLFVGLLFITTHNNQLFSVLLWNRMEIKDGKIQGDNRSNKVLDYQFSNFFQSNDLLFGKGINKVLDYGVGTSTYKSVIMGYGLVFTISLCIAFMSYSYFYIRSFKYILIYWFLFFSMIYQRYGFIFDPPRFFLFISAIYVLRNRAQQEWINRSKFD
jgi:hypothetical protein